MASRTSPRAPRRPVTVQAAATFLKVSPRTVERYIATGKLHAWKLGDRLVRLDQDEVDALFRPIPTAAVAAEFRAAS
jgi:excisionase family DNA binding protein